MFCLWCLLKAPLLELLIIKDLSIGDEWVSPSFLSFPLENELDHFPSLKTIGLISCDVPSHVDSTLLGLAQATPNVTHLMIICTAMERDISLDAFAHILTHSDVVHWPNLTTVCYLSSLANVYPLQDIEVDVFITQFANMLTHRAIQLQTHCTYDICMTFVTRI